VLLRLFRNRADVVVVRDLVNAQTVSMLCEQIEENRLMIGAVRAKDSAEACCGCWRWRAAGPVRQGRHDGDQSAVGAQLCEACKEAYTPPPQVSSSWAFPPAASRHSTGRRSRTPRSEGSLQRLRGIGYLGRTALSRCWRSATQSARP